MKMRLPAVFGAILLLAGCTDSDWDNTMSYIGMTPQPKMTPPVALAQPQTSTLTAPSYRFCHAVASQDASKNEFDLATQERIAASSFRQCVAVFGDADPN